MKSLFILITFLTSSFIGHAEDRPNVILINVDDLGWRDTGFNGSDFYETPHMDTLARQGITFTDTYAGASLCQPSRACLLSGQATPRHGIYAVKSTSNGPESRMRLVPVPNATELDGGCVTLAESLRGAGYATALFGKWHIGQGKKTGASAQGFGTVADVFESTKSSGVDADPKDVFAATERACDFITAQKDQPFFIYLAYHAIHSPLQARAETLARFKAKPPGKLHTDALYATCLFDLDEAVGRLLKQLADLQLDSRTLILLTGDNGATTMSSQDPLRGAKTGYYEGGIRVPLIARLPGRIAPGTTSDVPVSQLDIYPTLLALSRAAAPKNQPLDGQSLLPLLEGRAGFAARSLHWHFPGYWGDPEPRGRDDIFRARPLSVVRSGDWKLILFHEEWQLDGGREKLPQNNAIELYNLRTDQGEHANLAATQPAKRDELLAELLTWFDQVQAPLPTQPNPNFDSAKKLEIRSINLQCEGQDPQVWDFSQ
jgi:arylsulfatase A-like enzyme